TRRSSPGRRSPSLKPLSIRYCGDEVALAGFAKSRSSRRARKSRKRELLPAISAPKSLRALRELFFFHELRPRAVPLTQVQELAACARAVGDECRIRAFVIGELRMRDRIAFGVLAQLLRR